LTEVALVGLDVSDPPERWKALGFSLADDGRVRCGGVTLTLGIAPPGRGIAGWTLAGLAQDGDIDGLSTRSAPASGGSRWIPAARAMQRNGVVGIDHVVVMTPDLDAFAQVLGLRGLSLRHRAEVRGRAMGFRRLGSTILEVVQSPEAAAEAEAEATAFWGVTFTMAGADALDALCAESRFVGEPRPAVQPGRRITTVSRKAGLSTRVAFIDPEPPHRAA
jgi:hypothetical protein